MIIDKMLEALSHFPPLPRHIAKEGEGNLPDIRPPDVEGSLEYMPTSEPSKQDVDSSDVVY